MPSSLLDLRTRYVDETAGTADSSIVTFDDAVTIALTAGTGAGQVNALWRDEWTLTGGSATYLLSALVALGRVAPTVAMARVLQFYLRNLATAAGNTLVVTPGTTHPWAAAFGTGGVTVPAGGLLLLPSPVAGYAAVAAASDQFTITATGTCPYVIAVEGATV